MRSIKAIVLLLIVALLASCTMIPTVGEDKVLEQGERMKDLQAQKAEAIKVEPLMKVDQGFYLGVQTRQIRDKEMLPSVFDRQVVLSNSQPVTLSDVASRLTSMIGTPIRIAEGLQTEPKPMPFFEGTVRQYLDMLGAQCKVYWEYDFAQREIALFRVKTEIYTVNALSGVITLHDTITNESNAASDSGGTAGVSAGDSSSATKQRMEIKNALSIWEEVEANVETIVERNSGGTDVTSVSVNQTAGTVVVNASPMVLEQVRQYIDSLNKKLSKQVAIDVQVFALEMAKTSSVGFNLDAVYRQLSNGFTATVSGQSALTAPTGSGSLSAMILDTGTGSNMDKWGGSQVLLEALETFGKTSLVTSGSGITSNGQPLPIQNVNRQAYLARVSTTVTSDVGTTTELEAGVVTTGFSMIAMPHILDGDRLALQYSISLSSLDSLEDISSGDETIQVPEVSTRSFMQRVNMKVGSTLVLAGFEQTVARVKGGRGLTGAGRNGGDDHNLIIVAITVHDATGR